MGDLAKADPSTNHFKQDNASTLVIIVHGHMGSITGFDGQFGTTNWGDSVTGKFIAPVLGSGFSVLAIEMRNHGNSARASKPISFGLHESLDVLAALEYIAKNKDAHFSTIDRVVLMGESMGGASILHALGSDDLDPDGQDNLHHKLQDAGVLLTCAVVDSPPNSLKDVLVHYPWF